MHILRTLLVAAVVAADIHQTSRRSDPLLVTAVLTGDTIQIAALGPIRLLGIETPKPERNFESSVPFARKAKERLGQLVLHRWIRLEHEGGRTDAHQRRAAYAWTEDGQFVNAVLVREGLARVSTRVAQSRLAELQAAEGDARANRRGMWSTGQPH